MKKNNCKYTSIWSEMEIGDKVFFRKGDGQLLSRLRSTIIGSLKHFKKGTDKDFASQTVDYPYRGVVVYRVK